MLMTIFPAIDLKDGQCVRLVQGRADRKTVYSDQPEAVARKFAQEGAAWLHVVDLDGAFTGSSRNLKSIEKIAQAVDLPFQVGGGLRSRADVKRILELGVARVIIGRKQYLPPNLSRSYWRNSDRRRSFWGLMPGKAGLRWRDGFPPQSFPRKNLEQPCGNWGLRRRSSPISAGTVYWRGRTLRLPETWRLKRGWRLSLPAESLHSKIFKN